MSNQIVVVGSCMIDFFCYTPNLPKAGETVLGTKFTTGYGGKGANQCVAAAKLGGNTALVARLGDDTWGSNYVSSLQESGVNTSFLKITPDTASGVAQITVDDRGQNQIVIVRGANEFLTADDVISATEIISTAKVIVCQLETHIEVALKALELCNGVSILNGAPAILNADSHLFTLPTIFCVNETEAEVFTNLPVGNILEAKNAVMALIKKGCNKVILTLGSQGALLGDKNTKHIIHIPSTKVDALDTTGAGDAFIGALAYLIAEYPKYELEKCIEISCDMAANSVTKMGTHISFPDNKYLQEYINKNNL